MPKIIYGVSQTQMQFFNKTITKPSLALGYCLPYREKFSKFHLWLFLNRNFIKVRGSLEPLSTWLTPSGSIGYRNKIISISL